jgi:hypothetical protein
MMFNPVRKMNRVMMFIDVKSLACLGLSDRDMKLIRLVRAGNMEIPATNNGCFGTGGNIR